MPRASASVEVGTGEVPLSSLPTSTRMSHHRFVDSALALSSNGFEASRASLWARGERVNPISSLRASSASIAIGTPVDRLSGRARGDPPAVTPPRLNVAA